MTILITGGAGFVGLEIIRHHVARGDDDIVVFSRSASPARMGDLADYVTAIAGDVGNFSHVLNIIRDHRPDRIYHLGSMISVPSDADPAAALQTNAMGTFYVLEAARLFGVRQVIFASTIGTYGYDLPDGPIDDLTLQRPMLFYGVTKVFGENTGRFFKRKYGLDYRGIRYPSVIGPGVTTPGVVQYTSWMIDHAIRGEPFTVWVTPETRVPIMHVSEAADATIRLADAPADAIKSVNYLVDGAKPTPTAGELADMVRSKIPSARIDFQPDPGLQEMIDAAIRLVDDRFAREEWGWEPTHSLERIVDDFIAANA